MIDTSLPEYHAAANGWEADKEMDRRASQKRDRHIAGAALFIAALAVAAVCFLTPLKKVELRVVKVDARSGYSEIVTEVKDDALAYDDVKDQANLGRYVEMRERYAEAFAYNDYNGVILMSAPSVAAEYKKLMDPDSKASPLNVYGTRDKVKIHVVSVQLLGNGMASVRYTRQEVVASIEKPATHRIATVAYKYVPMKLSEEDRRVNPDQFQAGEYRTSSESVGGG